MSLNKKILVSIIIFSLFNYIGCYSFQQVQKEEFLSSTGKDVTLRTNDQDYYSFNSGYYIVRNDSIVGKGKLKQSLNGYTELKDYEGEVALKDIKEIRIEKVDVPETLGVSAVLSLLVIFCVAEVAYLTF